MHGCTGQGIVLGFACAFPFRDCARLCLCIPFQGLCSLRCAFPSRSPRGPLQKWEDVSHKHASLSLHGFLRAKALGIPARLRRGVANRHKRKSTQVNLVLFFVPVCGEIGIRTLVTVTRQPALQTGALDHSAISPKRYKCRCKICSKRHVTGCEYSKIFFS